MTHPTQQSITDLYNELVDTRDRIQNAQIHKAAKTGIIGGIEMALDRIAIKFFVACPKEHRKI
jgi:hypothetical protein